MAYLCLIKLWASSQWVKTTVINGQFNDYNAHNSSKWSNSIPLFISITKTMCDAILLISIIDSKLLGQS